MKIPPGNISSNDPLRAVFTNPTEIAFHKGNLKYHYPIKMDGSTWKDVEEWYQTTKNQSPMMNFERLQRLMILGMKVKLYTYPQILDAITDSGGEEWIKQCSHIVYGGRWEGHGLESAFIRCLLIAYQEVKA